MVIAVDPMMASMSPSAYRDSAQWSTHTSRAEARCRRRRSGCATRSASARRAPKQAKNTANIGKQWHPLHELDPEVVERDGHLHRRVRQVLVVVPQQHHLVVVREVAVQHGDRRRPHDGVDEPVGVPRQRAVVHPHVARRVERDAVVVGAGALPVVRRRGAHVRVAGGDAVVDVDVVDDDVGDVLERDARAAGAGAVTRRRRRRRRSRSLLATSWNPEGVCSWWSD
uniref:DAD domain-containing protein n=1 Tax=Oryza barthii TaxID=65489 RepID=A0A0D3FZ20_9ORYZ